MIKNDPQLTMQMLTKIEPHYTKMLAKSSSHLESMQGFYHKN